MSDSGRVSDFYRDDLARCARDWATTKNWTIPEALRERLAQFADAMTLPQHSPAGEGAQGTRRAVLNQADEYRLDHSGVEQELQKRSEAIAQRLEKLSPSLPPERAALVERLEKAMAPLDDGEVLVDDLILIPRWLLVEAAAALRGETGDGK